MPLWYELDGVRCRCLEKVEAFYETDLRTHARMRHYLEDNLQSSFPIWELLTTSLRAAACISQASQASGQAMLDIFLTCLSQLACCATCINNMGLQPVRWIDTHVSCVALTAPRSGRRISCPPLCQRQHLVVLLLYLITHTADHLPPHSHSLSPSSASIVQLIAQATMDEKHSPPPEYPTSPDEQSHAVAIQSTYIKPQARKLHDPDITLEEYYYYAQKTREEEKGLTPPKLRWAELLKRKKEPNDLNAADAAAADAAKHHTEVNFTNPEERLRISDEEWSNASRAFRTASWGGGVLFGLYLCPRDYDGAPELTSRCRSQLTS